MLVYSQVIEPCNNAVVIGPVTSVSQKGILQGGEDFKDIQWWDCIRVASSHVGHKLSTSLKPTLKTLTVMSLLMYVNRDSHVMNGAIP
jgi:hypothetical protein